MESDFLDRIDFFEFTRLHDSFNFDYNKLNQIIEHPEEISQFFAEEILAFACDGHEKKARSLGFEMMLNRIEKIKNIEFEKIRCLSITNLVYSKQFRTISLMKLNEKLETAIKLVESGRNIPRIFEFSYYHDYLLVFYQVLFIIKQIKDFSATFQSRLAELMNLERKYLQNCSNSDENEFFLENSIKSVNLVYDLYSSGTHGTDQNSSNEVYQPMKNAITYEILKSNTADAFKAYLFLSEAFFPDELDAPLEFFSTLNAEFEYLTTPDDLIKKGAQKHTIAVRWILVAIKDNEGKIIGISYGALLIESDFPIFYLSHIATQPKLRSRGIGRWLSSVILSVADRNLAEDTSLDTKNPDSHIPKIQCEVAEIEFPNDIIPDASSFKRLRFHSRLGRHVIWNLKYAQPDTNYQKSEFKVEDWNSVPMFLTIRKIDPNVSIGDIWYQATNIFWNYFLITYGEGVLYDLRNSDAMSRTINGIKEDVRLIKLPQYKKDISNFLEEVGIKSEILQTFYSKNKFTKDRLQIIESLQKSKNNG